MVNPLFVAFDLALVALAVRSMLVLGRRAPATGLGWLFTAAYGVAAALKYGSPDPVYHAAAGTVAFGTLVPLSIAFVVAGVRDEPQAEPWWWPRRIGRTRAERRR